MLKLEYKEYTLDFKFEAGTSRGVLTKHSVIFIKIYDPANPEMFGLGEAAPLPNLSPDNLDDIRETLDSRLSRIEKMSVPTNEAEVFHMVNELVDVEIPSLRMALETALLDLMNGGKRLIFDNGFYRGELHIPINGLIWMGKKEFMQQQIKEKLMAGYQCIKMKIGAIDFYEELELLKMLRGASEELIIRVDANGAFPTDSIFKHLFELSELNIHSIEQPIMPGQPEAMQLLCKKTQVPIALDEELIGITNPTEKLDLLKLIMPQYIILKPTLLGGFGATLEWISMAKSLGIGWWLTSALESNVSLNAIGQFAGNFENLSYQGLGTGQLYHNNIDSPLEISDAHLKYKPEQSWGEIF